MFNRTLIPIIALLAACASLPGCTGAGQRVPVTPERSNLPAAPAAGQANLPPLSLLVGPLRVEARPRSASYVPADLLRQAEAFSTALPHQHTSATPGGAAFAPDWLPQSPDIAGLSFAMYPFNVKGFGGDPVLYYSWIVAPPAPTDVYIALANWDTGGWDWFNGTAGGTLSLPEIAPYADFGGNLLACVVVTGATACELDWLRIGSEPPVPSLAVSPQQGFAPFFCSFDASGSTDADGVIAEYQWDPEGDGSFAESTGTDPHFVYEYTSAAAYMPAVRVIDSSGVYRVLATAVTAADTANFSFGGPDLIDDANAIVVGSDGHLLLFGERHDALGGSGSTLIAKLSPGGTADFAKVWDGPNSEALQDAVLSSGGDVYACGFTGSYGEGQGDALLQKWTQEGQLLWSRTIGNTDKSEDFDALVLVGSDIYACGYSFLQSTGQFYGLVVKMDQEGNLIWARTLIGPIDCLLYDIVYYQPSAFGEPAVRVCGEYYTSAGWREAIYAEYSLDGERLACKIWGEDGVSETATSLSLVGASTISTYIAGSIYSGTQSKAFIARPGGVAVELFSGAAEHLECVSLLGRSLLLSRTNNSDLYSMAIAVFDSTLGLLSQSEWSADANGQVFPSNLAWYDQTRLVIAGRQTGELPAAAGSAIGAQASATPWEDITPLQGSPLSMVLHDTPTDLTDLIDGSFNRAANDGDMLVYLYRY